MKKSMALFAITMVAATLSYAATLQSLSREKIVHLFQEHTITTIPMVTLNDKLTKNILTAYLDKNGKIIGQLATKSTGNPQGDKGVWSVKSDGSFCVTWEDWQKGKETCLYVYETQNMFIFVNAATNKFESGVLIDYMKEGDQMN